MLPVRGVELREKNIVSRPLVYLAACRLGWAYLYLGKKRRLVETKRRNALERMHDGIA
jgi:hypothetical protein